jgi:hypothetical protein
MRFVKQGLKLEKILYVLMNDKSWHIIYVVLFFSILIPTTLFLFSGNDSKSVNPRISVIVMKATDRDHIFPTQQGNTGAMDCFDKLMGSLKAGNLDFNQLRESMEKCFTMNFNEDGNNTDILPNPQDGNEPRFIVT